MKTAAPRHHVIVGSGVAGAQAARTLRAREPEARISILTLASLPFYNRYDLRDYVWPSLRRRSGPGE